MKKTWGHSIIALSQDDQNLQFKPSNKEAIFKSLNAKVAII